MKPKKNDARFGPGAPSNTTSYARKFSTPALHVNSNPLSLHLPLLASVPDLPRLVAAGLHGVAAEGRDLHPIDSPKHDGEATEKTTDGSP